MSHHRAHKAWLLTLLSTLLMLPLAASAASQTLRLGQAQPYRFVAFANADLHQRSLPVLHAVVVVHGVRRNAEDYYASAQTLLQNAGLDASDTLLLAPNFLTPGDRRAGPDMPLWPKDEWMHGTASHSGRPGIAAFTVLDDLLAYLADRQRFAQLQDILFIGHSAGGQLMQRYALLGEGDQRLRGTGIALRYVVSSPSSYLYVDDNRLQDGAFKPVRTDICPHYNRYRYGLEGAPAYFTRQGLSTRQVLQRYATRQVTFMVGQRDDNPHDRVMDASCAAQVQGRTRLERQLGYMRYERFLAQKWSIPLEHRQFQVNGTGHDAARLFKAKSVARQLFR